MKKLTMAAACAALLAPLASAAAEEAPASPHSFTANVTLASEYLYRGIAQTRGKPALQGGVDYAHSSGFYLGAWGSTITWIDDAVRGASAPVEIDIYGGYKGAITGDWGYDLGVLTYNYPGSGKTLTGVQELKQDTTELYGALSWKWLTLKYSRSTTALFGWPKSGTLDKKTRGSGYLELNAAYDLGDGWGLTGHVGHQKVRGNSDASYTDWKLGGTKDLGFGIVGLAWSTTNAKDGCTGDAMSSPSDVYCFVKHSGTSAYSAGKGRALLTFTKNF